MIDVKYSQKTGQRNMVPVGLPNEEGGIRYEI
jgi:hypothetical protein